MSSTMPRVYVVIMGVEKLVPTVEDAFLQYQALCRSATGQQCSVYLSMTSGPRKPGDADGPEEMHVILLDSGRVDMLAKGYGEALCCVRCGACLNVCPVYREIGGHAYGSTYSGPIGAVISPLLHTNVTDVDALPYASSLCGACRDACPVKIDLPKLLLDLRRDVVEEGNTNRFERMGMRNFQWLMQNRGLYEAAGKTAGFGTNLLAWLSGGTIKSLPGPFRLDRQPRLSFLRQTQLPGTVGRAPETAKNHRWLAKQPAQTANQPHRRARRNPAAHRHRFSPAPTCLFLPWTRRHSQLRHG